MVAPPGRASLAGLLLVAGGAGISLNSFIAMEQVELPRRGSTQREAPKHWTHFYVLKS